MAAGLEFGTKLEVVVDFPVEDDDQTAVLARHRLLSGSQVKNGEASMSKKKRAIGPPSALVRAPMREMIHQQGPGTSVGWRPFGSIDTYDSAQSEDSARA